MKSRIVWFAGLSAFLFSSTLFADAVSDLRVNVETAARAKGYNGTQSNGFTRVSRMYLGVNNLSKLFPTGFYDANGNRLFNPTDHGLKVQAFVRKPLVDMCLAMGGNSVGVEGDVDFKQGKFHPTIYGTDTGMDSSESVYSSWCSIWSWVSDVAKSTSTTCRSAKYAFDTSCATSVLGDATCPAKAKTYFASCGMSVVGSSDYNTL
jgi:hypothetical protein